MTITLKLKFVKATKKFSKYQVEMKSDFPQFIYLDPAVTEPEIELSGNVPDKG